MTTYLVFLLLGSLMLGAIFSPVAGILGYFCVYLLYNPHIWWGKTLAHYVSRPSFVAMCFLAGGCVLHLRHLDVRFTRREGLFYLFLATAWIVSFVFGLEVHELTWQYLEKLTKTFIFVFLLIRVVNRIDAYNLVVWTLVLGGVFLAYNAHGVGGYSDGRLDNIGGIDFREANAFASFLMFCIVALGFKLLRVRWWQKLIYIAGIGLMLNSVIMTQSRAVFIGMAMALPFVLLRTTKKYQKQILLYATLAVVLFFAITDVKFWERMGTINEEAGRFDSEQTLISDEELDRIDFWKASLKIFADHPMGIGVKNFELAVPLYDPRNPGMDAHNTYVLVYSELGVVGISIFVAILVTGWLQVSRIRRLAKGMEREDEIIGHTMTLQTVMIIYLLGTMVTHSNLYSEFIWILMALPICLEKAVLKETDRSE